GANDIVLHLGAHVVSGVDAGINKIIEGLNEVLTNDNKERIALETMAGKGTEICRSFDKLARIIYGVHNKERLSVSFATCHTHD
ncbi:TIM barrel protein, partial [Staphylococcus aureus]|uniref:TIM barrel protein n=1 Tax=Staphylococcus aureus TaxID=1280 RepID=UPI00065C13F8